MEPLHGWGFTLLQHKSDTSDFLECVRMEEGVAEIGIALLETAEAPTDSGAGWSTTSCISMVGTFFASAFNFFLVFPLSGAPPPPGARGGPPAELPATTLLSFVVTLPCSSAAMLPARAGVAALTDERTLVATDDDTSAPTTAASRLEEEASRAREDPPAAVPPLQREELSRGLFERDLGLRFFSGTLRNESSDLSPAPGVTGDNGSFSGTERTMGASSSWMRSVCGRPRRTTTPLGGGCVEFRRCGPYPLEETLGAEGDHPVVGDGRTELTELVEFRRGGGGLEVLPRVASARRGVTLRAAGELMMTLD